MKETETYSVILLLYIQVDIVVRTPVTLRDNPLIVPFLLFSFFSLFLPQQSETLDIRIWPAHGR